MKDKFAIAEVTSLSAITSVSPNFTDDTQGANAISRCPKRLTAIVAIKLGVALRKQGTEEDHSAGRNDEVVDITVEQDDTGNMNNDGRSTNETLDELPAAALASWDQVTLADKAGDLPDFRDHVASDSASGMYLTGWRPMFNRQNMTDTP